jgi:hypothetical protein
VPEPNECALNDRACPVEERLDEILTELRFLRSAFPTDTWGGADLAGHRRFHDAAAAAALAEASFWRELKLDLAKKGVWGILLVLIGLLIVGAAAKLGLTFK